MYVNTTTGLGACCGDCEVKGMGQVGGTWTWEDYLLIGGIGMLAVGFLFPSVFEPSKPKRRKAKKASSGGAGFLGGLTTMAVLGIGGYLAYQYFQNQSGLVAP